eukprot:5281187-Heterocapsa_arctica.AAC.1
MCLARRDARHIAREREVDERVRHKARLEHRDADAQGTVEAQGRRQRRDNLGPGSCRSGARCPGYRGRCRTGPCCRT